MRETDQHQSVQLQQVPGRATRGSAPSALATGRGCPLAPVLSSCACCGSVVPPVVPPEPPCPVPVIPAPLCALWP